MPSIVVDLNNSRPDGMKLLGATYNRYFQQASLSAVDVLDRTFQDVSGTSGVAIKLVFRGGEYRLKYIGPSSSGNRIVFKNVDPAGAAAPPKVKLQPVADDFDPLEPTALKMFVAFAQTREDLTDANNYLARTVTDIQSLSADLNSARQYTLAAFTFSRCR